MTLKNLINSVLNDFFFTSGNMKNIILIMDIKEFIPIATGIISGLIGSYITYYFTNKSKKYESMLKYKEEKYSNLLILLKGFVGNTSTAKLKKEFFDEQYKSWIYSSDDVIKNINYMIKLVKDSKSSPIPSIEGKKAVGNIVLAIRKDLNKKTKLTHEDFEYTDVID